MTIEEKQEIRSRILKEIPNFRGSIHAHKYSELFPSFRLSDGVLYLANEAKAFWLMDTIATLQTHPLITAEPRLKDMQFWELVVSPDGSAVLRCDWDEGETVYKEDLLHTDFPLESIRIWVGLSSFRTGALYKMAYLPSEH